MDFLGGCLHTTLTKFIFFIKWTTWSFGGGAYTPLTNKSAFISVAQSVNSAMQQFRYAVFSAAFELRGVVSGDLPIFEKKLLVYY
jgi:hypothetical protein